MRLLVIRHGESEADILHVHEGRADFDLTKRGRQQAEAMSRYVCRNYKIEKIYASPLKRAAQTAELLSSAVGIPVLYEDRLMEFNNGLLAGLGYAEADARYPKMDVPLHEAVYEQESKLSFRFRAEYMLSKILSENPDESTAAVVTHGGMIDQMYKAFLRLPISTDAYFYTDDTGIHEWVISGKVRRVEKANCRMHLL